MNRQLVLPPTRLAPILLAAVALMGIVGVWSSFYTVGTEEVGIVTRFGRYHITVSPGLKFCLPFGIDRVQKVPELRQMKEEFGFRTLQAARQTRYSPDDFPDESLMVTGDLNAVVVEWSVQYRIDDSKAYLFNVRDLEGTLRNASESVMREIVGDRTVDEILTVGRTSAELEARNNLQTLMDRYDMGLRIDQLVLQDINPPEPVRASFNAVNQAQQEKEKLINEARSEYNKVVPRASGEAEQKLQEAEGYALKRVNEARGDAEMFQALFKAYQLAPEVTRQRLYLETMQETLPGLRRKIIVDDAARSILPMLQLDPPREVPAP